MKQVSFPPHRINALLIISTFYSVVLISGLFRIQIFKGEQYTVAADRQHWNRHDVPALRGEIFSSDGYVLATNKLSYELFAEPPLIIDPKETAGKIIEILGVEKSSDIIPEEERDDESSEAEIVESTLELLAKRLTQDLQWVSLYHKITDEQRIQLKQLTLPGLGFTEEPLRSYPESTLASHVLGFIGYDYRGGDQGYFGVEGFYDGDLRGDDGEVSEERTAQGDPILVGEYQRVSPVNGRELHLTIDRSVQYIVENHLKSGVETFDATSGSVVVLDPITGAVLALANYPTFDPNDPLQEEEQKKEEDQEETIMRAQYERRNLAIAATYEPGSIIKPLTVSAALDQGLVNPKSTVFDTGPISASGFTVDNWDNKHHGEISMIDILVLSNNVGSAQVGVMVGASSLYDYFHEFGLGRLTGIDLEGEDTGIIKEPSSWREIDIMTAAFGQGFSATPLQLASAFGVFANEGLLMHPYIVQGVREKGEYTTFQPEVVTRVLKIETALTMRDMLLRAVDGGEARYYNIRNYKIAGKTGTAQIAEEGKYLKNKTNASFVGFLPSDPKFVLLVKLEKPTASIYAAETAVPVWMDITRELVVYFGIPPDK